MSSSDLPNVATLLGDLSTFHTLADRLQQGILNMQFLARLLKHPDGFASDPAFQAGAAHTPLIKTGEVYFNGNSQGGILGGAITAVSTEFTRAVLGVPAINYSTLLNRSVDYTQFSGVSTNAYPDPIDQQFDFSLIQMLWDRGEGDGYTQHLTDDPYPNTPRHEVLLIEAFGDHQVANIGTETFARSIGAKVWQPALAAGRSPDVVPFWGIDPVPSTPYRGSVLVMWDYGTPRPPLEQHRARGSGVRRRPARHGPRQSRRRAGSARIPPARRRVRRRVPRRSLPRSPLIMESIGLRELRQNASELVRRVEEGEELLVTVSGRAAAVLGPVTPSQWRTFDEIASIFSGPAEPEGTTARDRDDDAPDDVWLI